VAVHPRLPCRCYVERDADLLALIDIRRDEVPWIRGHRYGRGPWRDSRGQCRGLTRQLTDRPVDQRDDISVDCLWIIVEADQAPPGSKESHPPDFRRGREVSDQESHKSSFHSISDVEAPASAYQRQRTNEAMAIAILKSPLSPVIPA
jgi:hypothetical protein